MKRLTWIVCCSVCALGATAFAQLYDGSTSPRAGHPDTNQPSAAGHRDEAMSTQFSRSKDLVGANVKDTQGNKIGDIYELFINPRNGVTLAAIDIGNSRYALVPVQALNVNQGRAGVFHNAEVTLNTTKDALQSGPTLSKNEWRNLDDPSFTEKIYSHYHVQSPSGMGGASSSGGSSSGSSSSGSSSSQPEYGK